MKTITFCFLLLTSFSINAQSVEIIDVFGPIGMVRDGDLLYVSSANIDGGNFDGTIYRYDMTDLDSDPETVITGLDLPTKLVLNGNDLFILDVDDEMIYKVDVSIPNPVAEEVQFVDEFNTMALRGNELFYGEFNPNRISKIDITDPNSVPEVITTDVDGPYGMRFRGNELYLTEDNAGTIVKFDVTQPNPTKTVIFSGLDGGGDLFFYGNDLYFAEINTQTLSKIDITDPNPERIDLLSNIGFVFALESYVGELLFARYFANKISMTDSNLLNIDDLNVNKLLVYPNPVTDFINFSNSQSIDEIVIFNSLGLNVKTKYGIGLNKIDVSDLKSGVYFLNFRNNTNSGTVKFIKK